METKKKVGRPAHVATPYQIGEAQELTLLDRFLVVPRFRDAKFVNQTREDAVATVMGYALTGSLAKASQISGVNYNLVKQWRKQSPWWDECVGVAREVISEKLEDKFTSILNEALSQLSSRLETGNIFVRDGKTYKTPIPASELTKMIQVLFDKRQLIRGDVTSRSETKSVETRLDDIKKAAEEFMRRQEAL